MQCFKVSANSNAGRARQRGAVARCKWGRGRAVRSGTRPVRHGHTRTTTIWRCTYVRADQTRPEQRERAKRPLRFRCAVHTHPRPMQAESGRGPLGSCIALARVRMHGWGGFGARACMDPAEITRRCLDSSPPPPVRFGVFHCRGMAAWASGRSRRDQPRKLASSAHSAPARALYAALPCAACLAVAVVRVAGHTEALVLRACNIVSAYEHCMLSCLMDDGYSPSFSL